MQKIHIIGEGITAKAVREKITADKLFVESSLEDCDFVVVSPGTKPKDFPETDKDIISEIEFAFRYYVHSPVIAITGTNGKSTVTALIAEGLGVEPLGNFGKPLISANFEDPYHVVEVSSYQLETCFEFQPHIAVITNITPDHLDWHETFENYFHAKKNICLMQTKDDYVVYFDEDQVVKDLIRNVLATKRPFFKPAKDKLKYNQNYWAAREVFKILKKSEDEIEAIFQNFKGLPWRIQRVADASLPAAVYNDSKSTNPESAIFALQQFDKNIVLLLGGRDKNTDLRAMKQAMQNKIRRLYVYGEAKERFAAELSEFSPIVKEDLQAILKAESQISMRDEIILFSPACASFDQFKNYEDRGQKFNEWVKAL